MERYSSEKDFLLMSRNEVRAFDAWAINTLGIPGAVLMENAGRSCAEMVIDKLTDVVNPKVCIFCGTGNNGGDGYVIARHLANRGFQVKVIICGDTNKIGGDAKTNLDIIEKMRLNIENINFIEQNISEQVKDFAEGADMLVDSLFGTGLKGQLKSDYYHLIESINILNRPILAVDIPSGLDCDTGLALGVAIEANWTVTFVAVKKGFSDKKAVRYTGDIFVASIGIVPSQKAPA